MNAWRLVARNALVYRRDWVVFLTGFTEPVFYLLSIGIGVGTLIHGFEVGGTLIPYAQFVAPAMLATSAANGAIMDSTFTIFFRLRHARLYDSVLATPLSTFDVAAAETAWALSRGGVYATGFLVIMLVLGYVTSWWALLIVPAALVIGYGFAGAGLCVTTYMKSWQDFEYLTLALMPMVLFSGTFFPVEAFAEPIRWVVEVTPLYRGVVLCRELTTGLLTSASLVSVAYLLVMGSLGLTVARRRLDALLLR